MLYVGRHFEGKQRDEYKTGTFLLENETAQVCWPSSNMQKLQESSKVPVSGGVRWKVLNVKHCSSKGPQYAEATQPVQAL